MRTRPTPPRWFLLTVAVVGAVLLRVLVRHVSGAAAAAPTTAPHAYAFLGWIIAIANVVWGILTTVATVTIEFLWWTLQAVWAVALKVLNGLGELGGAVLKGFARSWDFLKAIYEDVLKPAWVKFWQLFDKVRTWLNDTFGPIFDFLRHVRDEILCFYKTFIRPWLDVLDATRGILRVLATLHVPFAAKLEAQLGTIEDWVNAKFQFVLSKVNEVIDVLDRVVTANGLFQRIAYIRTFARDIHIAGEMFFKTLTKTLDDAERKRRAKEVYKGDAPAAPGQELAKFYGGSGGEFDGIIGELAPLWREAAGLSPAATPPL